MDLSSTIIFLFGVIIGMLIASIGVLRLLSGTIRIDHNSQDKDIYRLEINDLDHLAKRRCVLLKVDSNADLSHE